MADSVFWQPSIERWVGVVELPRERSAPRRRKVFHAKTREDVEGKLAVYRESNPAPPVREILSRDGYMTKARELGHHTDADWWRLVRQQQRRCHYCGIEANVYNDRHDPTHLEKDHRVPVSRGGSNGIENVVVSCHGCNMEKGTMTETEYLAWKAKR